MTAPINKILPLSVVDGPGNRVSIFFQKCNIACAYCHNPETQKMCINCGKCVAKCKAGALTIVDDKVLWTKELCVDCDLCIQSCENFASPKVQQLTPKEVFETIKKSMPFIRGITASGGECMLYPSFLQELFTLCKNVGLTCLIDSNGTIDLTENKDLVELCDGIMLDVKEWDLDRFFKLTGASNKYLEKNIRYLDSKNKIEELRIVCIEDLIDTQDILYHIANTVENPQNIKIKLIAFRNNGVKGELTSQASPSSEYMGNLKKYAMEQGFLNVLEI